MTPAFRCWRQRSIRNPSLLATFGLSRPGHDCGRPAGALCDAEAKLPTHSLRGQHPHRHLKFAVALGVLLSVVPRSDACERSSKVAINRIWAPLAASGTTFSSDDVELIEVVPFSETVEACLQRPEPRPVRRRKRLHAMLLQRLHSPTPIIWRQDLGGRPLRAGRGGAPCAETTASAAGRPSCQPALWRLRPGCAVWPRPRRSVGPRPPGDDLASGRRPDPRHRPADRSKA